MKWLLYFVFIFLITIPVSAQEFNAGIVQGLWYSQETIFAEQPVRIYVAIRNNTGNDLTGTVEFFDGEERIDRVSVSALDGRIIERWADWTPTYGEHTIKATLSRTKLSTVGEASESVEVTAALSEDTFFVDYDTDKDGVGNKEDVDDDGDGISDAVEKTNGTDPLVYNEPPVISSEEEITGDKPPKENESGDVGQDTSDNQSNRNSEGLEQYLTPSRADTMLGGVTRTINSTKEKLDTYRYNRAVQNGTAEPIVEEVEVNKDGFGEITRTSKEETKAKDSETKREENKPKTQKPGGFLGDIFTFIGTIVSGIYTGILTTISFALGYPILMQLLLLLGILFTLYKTAKKLGGRPK